MSEAKSEVDAVEGEFRADTKQEFILLRDIRQALFGLEFGEITITVRNGKIIEIERVARNRQLRRNERRPP